MVTKCVLVYYVRNQNVNIKRVYKMNWRLFIDELIMGKWNC